MDDTAEVMFDDMISSYEASKYTKSVGQTPKPNHTTSKIMTEQ